MIPLRFPFGTIIAILRNIQVKDAIPIAHTLIEHGIHWIEVSLSDEEMGLACIEQLNQSFSNEIHLGAGTVTYPTQVDRAIKAGAQYIITPGWDTKLAQYVKSINFPMIPGVYSPGEIMQAQVKGFQTVKLFPAANLGPTYIQSMRGPFPEVHFMAVGGIHLDNLVSFAKAGCNAFAIGSELVPQRATQQDVQQIAERALQYRKIVDEMRNSL